MVIYIPGEGHSTVILRIMQAARSVECRGRGRRLTESDVKKLLSAIDNNPDAHIVRQYSGEGFVENSTKGNPRITRATATRTTIMWTITVERVNARIRHWADEQLVGVHEDEA